MNSLRRRPKDMPPRRDRSDEFTSFELPRPSARMVTPALLQAPVKPPTEKLPRSVRTRQSIRDAANGEECTVRIVGACVGGTDTTVLSHWPGLDGDRGLGIKALDLCGAFACKGCHDVIDGRAKLPAGASPISVQLDWFMGHLRTLVRLAKKGLV